MSNMPTNSRHQAGLTALYLGIFATVWFSVPAVEQPWRALLVVGSVASMITAVLGGVMSGRPRGEGGGAQERATNRRYLLIVVAEFAAAGLGAVLLAAADRSEYIPVLVCAVVGLHFFPLAPLLRDPLLRPLGVALCVVAAAGLVAAFGSAVAAGRVVGTGAGLLLLGYAVQALVRARRPA
ncbi:MULTISPECIES: hypothetical protein [Micromonospora]|uniref:Uncharacterized protein n=2 Tax=Micromonospora zamorensis TaxID=709883 RepID=A0ABZ1PGX2_9ACTN|nr:MULTISPECIES: hypothetical protein [Micromonospora]MBQ1038369.1 hypothetical protein [Micromonospora sp. C81]WTE86894.1 hypothetical protein OHA01_31065 [Micromonospora zamorensis]WTI21669.1 hypothetical protein OG886_00645 [Micromonospora zamorensis]SCG60885.1 hypothetical protein GA0070619_4278 [Micromonospora zamorensis]